MSKLKAGDVVFYHGSLILIHHNPDQDTLCNVVLRGSTTVKAGRWSGEKLEALLSECPILFNISDIVDDIVVKAQDDRSS